MKYQNCIEGSLGKSHKKAGQGGSKLDTGAGCENLELAKLQVAKFSQPYKIYVVFQFLTLFAPFSF